MSNAMPYYVSMQQTDFFGFTHVFTNADAEAIRNAEIGVPFDLSNGFGTLWHDGDFCLTFSSGSGHRLYDLNRVELLRQFAQIDANKLDLDEDEHTA